MEPGSSNVGPVAEAAARSWHLLSERLAGETDERLRSNLAVVKRHVASEVAGDLEGLMATLVPEPEYQFLGAPQLGGDCKGYEPVRALYEAANNKGRNRREYDITHIVVDRETVVTEGILRHATLGSDLMAQGFGDDAVEPGGWYLTEDVTLIVWPINVHGLITGERVWFADMNRAVKKLQPGEHPHLGPVWRPAS